MKHYTGIGSRQTPRDILALMEKIAYKLAQENYILRSGSAGGADTAFENGAKNWDSEISDGFNCPSIAQIYIPWSGFVEWDEYYKDWYKVLDRMTYKDEAAKIAASIHPAWERCSRGAKALHTRNVFQVLGANLKTPSNFLVCWAKTDKHGEISGGTATAWNLAKDNGVQCFNLYVEEDRKRIEGWLNTL